MRILVFDSDVHLVDLVAGVLATDGHDVFAVTRGDQVSAALRRGAFDVVVADVDFVVAHGVDLVLAGVAGSRSAAVVLTSPRPAGDGMVRSSIAMCQAARFLAKPFSLLDLSASIDELAPRRPAPPARTLPAHLQPGDEISDVQGGSDHAKGGRQAMRNASTLARVWASGASGTIRLEHAGPERECGVSQGGPLDEGGMRLLRAALAGGRLVFEEGRPRGVGDWKAFGRVLFDHFRNTGRLQFADQHRFRAITRTRWFDRAGDLPLRDDTRRLLAAVHPAAPLGELLVRHGISPEEVSPDLHCLRRLRLIDLQEPVAANPVALDRVLQRPQANPARAAEGIRAVTAPREWTNPDSITSVPSGDPPDAREGGGARSRRQEATRRMRVAEDPAAVVRRLEKELARLRDAPPAVVLGVPAFAAPDLVKQVARRMADRYAGLAREPTLPESAREMSAEIGRIVAAAHARMVRGQVQVARTSAPPGGKGPPDIDLRDLPDASERTPDPTSSPRSNAGVQEHDVDQLLQHGRRLILLSDWERADRVLARARDLRLNNAEVLANLAWARLHNPAWSPEGREEEARDLFLLAEQLDDRNAEVLVLHARFLFEYGDPEEAARRTAAALAIAPGEAAVVELDRKIRRRIAGG